MRGRKGTRGGAGIGWSYDCPICKRRHREGSPIWEEHLPIYEASIKKDEGGK
jgi:hypothetical protein